MSKTKRDTTASRRFRAAVFAAMAMVARCGIAHASIGYSNQTPIVPLTGDQSIFGTGGAIFDDALISSEMNPTGAPIQVTSVTFGLVRDRNAPSMTLSAYCGTPTTVSPDPVLNNAASFGSISIASYSGSTNVLEYTITPPSPMFVTPNLTDQPGFNEIAVGLLFSSTSNKNSWAVAIPNNPNWDGAWDYNFASGTGAAYSLPDYTTFAMTVNTALPSAWKPDASGNWSTFTNWWGGNSFGAGTGARFGGAITSDATITLDGGQTVGTLIFDNANRYTIVGTQTLTINTISGNGSIAVVSGSHTIATPLFLAKTTNIGVGTASTLTVTGDLTANGGVTLDKIGAGVLAVKNLRLDAVTIENTGTVQIIADGTSTGTSKIKSLSIAAGAQLDLVNNSLVVDYTGSTVRPAIEQQIKTGYNAGSWDGSGINSSAAAASASTAHRTALGIAEATDLYTMFLATFRGQSVDNTSVLVRYTAAGDANLDGTVDLTDFTLLAANFNGTSKRWFTGDFDYSGTVDLTDFTILASNFNYTLPASLGATVPEPTALTVAALMALGLARRHRGYCALASCAAVSATGR